METGSLINFFPSAGDGRSAGVVYATGLGAAAPDDPRLFAVEVFTGVNPGVGAIDPGFEAAVFIEGGFPEDVASATVVGDSTVYSDLAIAPTFSVTLLAGDFVLSELDLPSWSGRTQPALITLGIGAQTVSGEAGDTIIGGSGNITQSINPGGSSSVLGGSAPLIVGDIGGIGASPITVTGSSGPITVFSADGDREIAGGSGDMIVLGNQPFFPGGTDARPGNTIAGSASEAGNVYVFAGIGDTITGGLGPMTVSGGGGGTFPLAPALSDSIIGGAGDMTIQGGGAASQ
jgi:hypothetical protein